MTPLELYFLINLIITIIVRLVDNKRMPVYRLVFWLALGSVCMVLWAVGTACLMAVLTWYGWSEILDTKWIGKFRI